MADNFKRVAKGDPISAAAWNALVGLARGLQEGHAEVGYRPGEVPLSRARTVMFIRNDSGADLSRFGVLGITGVFPTPDEAEASFKAGPILTGTTPAVGSHEGRFAVVLEPIEDGKIGQAVVSGVTVAFVDVIDTTHTHCDIKDDDQDSLESATGGSAVILWKDSGTGVQEAVIRIGVGNPELYAKAQADWADADYPNGPCTVSLKLCDRDGTNERGDAFTAKCDRDRNGLTAGADPAIYSGDVVRWNMNAEGHRVVVSEYLHMDKIKALRMQGRDDAIPTGWHEADGSSQTGAAGTFNLIKFNADQQAVVGDASKYGALPMHKSSSFAVGNTPDLKVLDSIGSGSVYQVGAGSGSCNDSAGDTQNCGQGEYPLATVFFIQRYK